MSNILNFTYNQLLNENSNYEEYLINLNTIVQNKLKKQINKIVKNEKLADYIKDELLFEEIGAPIYYSENLILFQKNKKAYKIIIPLTIFFYVLFSFFVLGIPSILIKIITFNFKGFGDFFETLAVMVFIPLIYFANVIGEYMSTYVFNKNKVKAILFPFNKVGRDYIYTILFTKGLTFTQNDYVYSTSVVLYKDYRNFDDLIKYNEDLSKLDTKTFNKLKELYLEYKNNHDTKK